MSGKFEIVRGDILDHDGKVICHQVNCQNKMGSGVAEALYSRWYEVKREYHKLAGAFEPEELLGNIQPVRINEFGGRKVVINMFTQLDFGRKVGKIYTDYDALAVALDKVNKICVGESVAFPHGFACGQAGGDWLRVERLLAEHLKDVDVKIYLKEGADNGQN